MNLVNYRPPSRQNWQGRSDSLSGERFFQIVELLDVNNKTKLLLPPGAFGLIGFCCDVGITRNLGRPGAALGPQEFRKYFGNLAVPLKGPVSLYDLGDIKCAGEDLETAQQDLSKIVRWARDMKLMPIVIGGGHELSFGAYVGAAESVGESIGIINFDAHLDVRPYQPAGANSGSSFLQIADWCEQHGRKFDYLVLGLQPAANTASLFSTATKLGASWLSAEELVSNSDYSQQVLDKFITKHSKLYLTLCLDVFAHALAPGVSAPQPLGVWPLHVMPLITSIIKSRKLIGIDVAEYSPPLDEQGRTGRLCASMVYSMIKAGLA